MFWRTFSQIILRICLFVGGIISLIWGCRAGANSHSFFVGVFTIAGLLLITLIICSSLGIIVEGLTHLEQINQRMSNLEQILNKPKESSITTPSKYVNKTPINLSTDWNCPKCSTTNDKSKSYCKNCGSYR